MADSGLAFKIIFVTLLASILLMISVQSAPTESTLKITRQNQSDSAIKNVSTTEIPATTTTVRAQDNREEDNEDDEGGYDVITDQKQNGTENYRITLKDLVLIWAPSDALLAAAALLDPQALVGDFLIPEKPLDLQEGSGVNLGVAEHKNNSTSAGNKPPEKEMIHPETKPVQLRRNFQHLPAVLGPFLRRKV